MAKMNFKAMGCSHVISKESSKTLLESRYSGIHRLTGDNIPEGVSLF